MTLNITALKKFQETFGPVLEAIPAVLEGLESKADLERGVNALKTELAETQAQIEARIAEGNRTLERINASIDDLVVRREVMKQEFSQLEQGTAEKTEAVKKEYEIQAKVLQSRLKEIQQSVETALRESSEVIAEAQNKSNSQIAIIEGSIKEVEARKASAERALDNLRAKLG